MRNAVLTFIVACFLGGAGGMLGSILGNAAGRTGLFVGGVIGGVVLASLTGVVARWRRWIPTDRARSTGVGVAVGFLAAALIATRTLGSPIGPILSTSLIGIGALIGARSRGGRRQT